MHSAALSSFVPLLCLLTTTTAAPTYGGRRDSTSSVSSSSSDEDVLEARAMLPPILPTNGEFPFNKIVAFGDDYSDDGSGSYAHGITGNRSTGAGKHLWGANTWTDGKVAVSWMAQQMQMPMSVDYAFGSAGGGAQIGSICDNSVIPPGKYDSHARIDGELVPDALGQINNYTSSDFTNDIENTLHFLWTGNNDVIPSLGWTGRFTICSKDTKCTPSQDKFVNQITGCFQSALMKLVNAGAQHILVPNIYPRNLTPWMRMWISGEDGMIANFGTVIDRANAALKEQIDQINEARGTQIMYYDANAFMQQALLDPSMVAGAAYTNTCVDGCKIKAEPDISNWNMYWQNTVTHHQPDDFYWLQEVVASTTVHKYLANDMLGFLAKQYSPVAIPHDRTGGKKTTTKKTSTKTASSTKTTSKAKTSSTKATITKKPTTTPKPTKKPA